jgi:hypothetical protein
VKAGEDLWILRCRLVVGLEKGLLACDSEAAHSGLHVDDEPLEQAGQYQRFLGQEHLLQLPGTFLEVGKDQRGEQERNQTCRDGADCDPAGESHFGSFHGLTQLGAGVLCRGSCRRAGIIVGDEESSSPCFNDSDAMILPARDGQLSYQV